MRDFRRAGSAHGRKPMLFAILAILSFALQNTCCKEYGNRYPNTLYAQSVMIFVSVSYTHLDVYKRQRLYYKYEVRESQ